MRTKGCWLYLFLLFGMWFLVGAAEAWGASPLAARLIDLRGQVVVARGGTQDWRAAEVNQELFAEDAIKTGPDSRAAILCADESQIKLNENTVMVLKSVAPSSRLGLAEVQPAAAAGEPQSLYQVLQGEIWLRNNKEKFPFAVETPAVTAAIRGTEFNLRVSPDGASVLTLLSGSLELVNKYGHLMLQPGEEGMARPGQAPTKRVIVQPADAVQWSLYYPGIFSFRDLPLTPGVTKLAAPAGPRPAASLVSQAEANYDQGNLGQAQTDAEAALNLDPRSDGALTVLGWLRLQQQDPKEAENYFLQVPHPDDRAVVGLALSRYRLGDVPGAYHLLQDAQRRLPPSPLLGAMVGFMALMAGKVEEARTTLQSNLQQWPGDVLARCLLAQIHLVQNHKEQGKEAAAQALKQAPASPMAQLTVALVDMAYFDLPAASQHLQRALEADPRFVTAYVYLAKVQLGGDYLNRAWDTIRRALKLAPHESEVLSLAGFIRLAFRDYDGAKHYFDLAVKADPGLGDPHLGLGIYAFRHRNMDRGLGEMLTATLLQPRISLYQSELGKALYQVHAFDKALQVYDYAKTLDKNDPTPYLYKGIALTDLNRPTEAVQEINQAIALNGNKAVFRSRIMLDRDQAVNNYSLARAYNQLGLGEWAYSKAVTSVQQSPTSGAAHLFLNQSYTAALNIPASNSSYVLYYLLSPANQNTFTQAPTSQSVNYIANDYTPMFEMPYWRAQLQGGIGAWKSDRSIQQHSLEAYGGLPGLALDASAYYRDDQGFRNSNGSEKDYALYGLVKWEPTVQHSLLFMYSYYDFKMGDNIGYPNDYNYNSTFGRDINRASRYEFGYVYRFNPNATFLAYYNYYANDFRHNDITTNSGQLAASFLVDPYLYSGYFNYYNINYYSLLTPSETHNAQFQQQLILGDHTFLGGFDYFTGHYKYRYQKETQSLLKDYQNLTLTELFFPFTTFSYPFTLPVNESSSASINRAFRPPFRSYTFYLLDYWKIRSNLLIEMGLFKDIAKSPREGFAEPIYNNKWSPRLGINYMVTDTQTLRLVLQESVNSHYGRSPTSLVPPEVASFPWQVNTVGGSLVREAGLAWEAQWNAKTFSVLRMDALRVDRPAYDVDSNGQPFRDNYLYHRYQASFTLNRILGQYYGLSLGALAKKFDPTWPNSYDYKEYKAFAKLVFWHPSGWWAWINPLLVKQDLTEPTPRGGNLFGLLNASIGYQFPGKRGVASLEVDNVFNRHFNYVLDPTDFYVPYGFNSQRSIIFKVALFI